MKADLAVHADKIGIREAMSLFADQKLTDDELSSWILKGLVRVYDGKLSKSEIAAQIERRPKTRKYIV